MRVRLTLGLPPLAGIERHISRSVAVRVTLISADDPIRSSDMQPGMRPGVAPDDAIARQRVPYRSPRQI